MPRAEPVSAWPAAAAAAPLLLRGLWDQNGTVWAMPDAEDAAQAEPAPVLQLEDDRFTLHLPPGALLHWPAVVAHAAAHIRFGGPPQGRKGLKPVQQALLGVLEDARVEWLACQELPGLRDWWRPFHTGVQAREGQGFEDLLARLSATLLDPTLHEPHPWIAKVRQLFFERDGTTLALRTPEAVRGAASRLGNDIGQMRLPFNARTYRVHARYRDDNTHLWLPSDEDRAADTPLLDDRTPDEPPGTPPAAPAPWQLGEPVADYPEWDHRIGRYRLRWTQVHEVLLQGIARAPVATDAATQRLVHRCRRRLPAFGLGPERQIDGDELHATALIDHAVALRLRQTPDARVWRRPRASLQAQAVLLLVDASVSTADVLVPWQFEVQRAALALQAMGHRSAVWAFGSDGRHRVRMQRLKDWAERCEHVPWGALEPGGSTRMGAALRHAADQCASRHSPAGVAGCTVLLLTDGELHDIDVHDPAYLAADLDRAVREARTRGVRVQALLSSPAPALSKALGSSACHRVTAGGWVEALSDALTGRG